MTDLSVSAIAQSLMDLSRDLNTAQQMLAEADLRATHAKHDYEQAHAKATICATGQNAEARRAEATLETADLSLTAEAAAQVVRSIKERMNVLKVRIDVGRSLSAALRFEVHA